MPIPLSCFCGHRFKVSDRLQGKQLRCPECGEVLQVPDGAASYRQQQDPWQQNEDPSESPLSKVPPAVWIVGGGGLLGVLLLMAVISFAGKEDDGGEIQIANNDTDTNETPRETTDRHTNKQNANKQNTDRQKANERLANNRNANNRKANGPEKNRRPDPPKPTRRKNVWPSHSWKTYTNYRSSLEKPSLLPMAPEYTISPSKTLGNVTLSEAGIAKILRWAEESSKTDPGMVVHLVIEELPDRKKGKTEPKTEVEKLARILHGAHVRFRAEKVDEGKINGMEFARMYWSSGGGEEIPRRPLRGVDYVAFDGANVIHLSAWDQDGANVSRLLSAEAMIQSFDRTRALANNDRNDPENPGTPAKKDNSKPDANENKKNENKKTVRLVPADSDDKKENKQPKTVTEWSSNLAKNESGWGGNQPAVRIPLPKTHNSKIVYSSGPKPFVLIGQSVYDPRTGKRIGMVPVEVDDRGVMVALGHDGKFVAQGFEQQEDSLTVDIYETATGKKVKTLEYIPKPDKTLTSRRGRRRGKNSEPDPPVPPRKLYLRFLCFVGENKLLASMHRKTFLWNLETGVLARPIDVSFSRGSKDFAISRDGNLLAVKKSQGVSVYNLRTGRAIAGMAQPKHADGTVNSLFWCDGLAFSPDMKELAGWFRDSIVVWDRRGKVIYHEPVTDVTHFTEQGQENLQWLPDRSGWLLAGREFFDRERKMKLWKLQSPTFYTRMPHLFIDDDHLLVARKIADDAEMASYKIPWDLLKTARKTFDSNADSYIGPGSSVSIQVTVDKVYHANQKQVATKLKEALIERLKKFDIAVKDSQETVFKIDYAEEPGRMLRIVEGGFGVFGGTDSGRRVRETVGKIKISLTSNDDAEPLWKWKTEGNTGLIVNTTPTAPNLRNEMFKWIETRVKSIDFPRFISKDKNAPRLPIVTNLDK